MFFTGHWCLLENPLLVDTKDLLLTKGVLNLKPYLFVINVIPMQENEIYENVAGAKAHIWVISKDKESAKLRAINYNEKFHWEIIDFEYEFEIHEEQIPKLHEDESRLYQSALSHGIAADYLAYVKH